MLPVPLVAIIVNVSCALKLPAHNSKNRRPLNRDFFMDGVLNDRYKDCAEKF
jgi:hypothetical protein